MADSPNRTHSKARMILLRVAAVISLAIIVAATWSLFVALRASPEARAGVISVLVAVISIHLSKRWERTRDIEVEHRKVQLPIYEEFIKQVFGLLLPKKGTGTKDAETKCDDPDLGNYLREFMQQIILWGSGDVLKKYRDFTKRAAAQPGDPGTFIAFESLLYAIRSELGHSNKGLGQKDLLRMFINDIDSPKSKDAVHAASGGTAGAAAAPAPPAADKPAVTQAAVGS